MPACLFRRAKYLLVNTRAQIINCRDHWFDPQASSFFRTLIAHGYKPNAHIDVLPRHRLIYVSVPKCASTTIKAALSALNGRSCIAAHHLHSRRHTGLLPPAKVGLSAFYRLATASDTLRFAFVRNPYARLVSAWADKFKDRPLVPGHPFVDIYLDHRATVDPSLPKGADATLTFAQFVRFATATASSRLDAHWQLQHDLINMPGIALDFVGRAETFHADFDRVLNHVASRQPHLRAIGPPLNVSRHEPWPDYYNTELSARVYRAYERDFDNLRYARAITATAGA